MPKARLIRVDASAATLPGALTEALTQLVSAVALPAMTESSLTGTIRAETRTTTELLPTLTDSLTGLLADFDALPIAVSIDGLRWLDDTVRAWGTVTLSPDPAASQVEIMWPQPPNLSQIGDVWQVDGQAEIVID